MRSSPLLERVLPHQLSFRFIPSSLLHKHLHVSRFNAESAMLLPHNHQTERFTCPSCAFSSPLLRALLLPRTVILAENLALRHHSASSSVVVKRPKLRRRDRIFWVWLSQLWSGWRSTLLILQPDTVVRWHQQGFRIYWRWKSRGKPGRPKIDPEIRRLIRQMSRENVTWGAPRIHSELSLLAVTQ